MFDPQVNVWGVKWPPDPTVPTPLDFV